MKALDFVERLKNTPLGRRLMRDADRSERIPQERAALVAELAALQTERDEQLPALAAEEARIIREAVDSTLRMHQEALAAQQRRRDVDNRTFGRLNRIRRQLQETADRRLDPTGPFGTSLSHALRHLESHDSAGLEAESGWAREMDNEGLTTTIGQQVALVKACNTVRAAYANGVQRLEALRMGALKPEDVDAGLAELVAELPKRCPCGFAFPAMPVGEIETEGVAA